MEILFKTSEVVTPSLEKEFTAAVKPSTADAASRPDNLDKIIESLSLLKTSSDLRPWRLNSRAASETV